MPDTPGGVSPDLAREQIEQTLALARSRTKRVGESSLEVHVSTDDRLVPSSDPMAFATLQADMTTIAQCEAGLDAIENGNYGICEDCGGEIDPRRLMALPEATTCIGCQNLRDQNSKKTAKGGRR